MNKKILIGIIVVLTIIGIIFIIDKKNKIPTYDADIICSYSTTETLDDEEYESKSYIYIYKDDYYVSKSIHQSIMSNNSDTSILESIIDLYSSIDGIDASLKSIDASIVFEVVYDFDIIDIDLLKENMGDLLSESSILMTTSELPIKVDDYLDSLSDNYKCEVK